MRFHENFRQLVPVTQKFIYLNHAAISPTPLPVYYEVNRYLIDVMRVGSITVNQEEIDELFHIREKIGKLINSSPDEISLIPNTSYGINIVAHGVDLKEGENVVTDNLEFPATVYPFIKLQKRGVKVKIAKVRPETIEDDILSETDKNTRLISISHVSFNTGVRIDVKKIVKEAKELGALVLLDIIQSAGAVDINVKELDVDFAVAGGYKWLMAPQGSGFIYVKKGLIEDPPFYGWKSSSNYLDFDAEHFIMEKGPRRFEIGTIDIAANLGLAKSCEIIDSNKEEIFQRVLQLSEYTIKLAEENKFEAITPKDKRAGIVVIKVKNPKKASEFLLRKGIIVSPRGEGIRISTHFYNMEEEIEKTIVEIKNYLKEVS
jgi:selenocysteine lyase/cysteine desulfurase